MPIYIHYRIFAWELPKLTVHSKFVTAFPLLSQFYLYLGRGGVVCRSSHGGKVVSQE